MAQHRLAAALAWGGMAFAAATAHADSSAFCIICEQPDRTYICRVEAPAGMSTGALQFYCVVRTAREGGHKSCAVNRQVEAPCVGFEKAYVYDGPALPAPQPQAAEAPAPIAPPPAAQDAPKGPATVVELTSKAARATGTAVRNTAGTAARSVKTVTSTTGEAARNTARTLGGAARNAFNCLRSLFSDCGSNAPDTGAE